MIEIPESSNLAKQLNTTLKDKKIASVLVMKTPHKFAFTNCDPAEYPKMMLKKTFSSAQGYGSWVDLAFEDANFMVSEGVRLLYTKDKNSLPDKHQMLLRFEDDSYLCAHVLMYGGLVCALNKDYAEKCFLANKEKPSVLSSDFNEAYFESIVSDETSQKRTIKGLLATEQRIPGLGNGVLQDILFNAKMHPKTKVALLTDEHMSSLFWSIKKTLREMTDKGGRNTEVDLFGSFCGYQTIMSKNTEGSECPECGTKIEKATYMGGSIYFCPTCQILVK